MLTFKSQKHFSYESLGSFSSYGSQPRCLIQCNKAEVVMDAAGLGLQRKYKENKKLWNVALLAFSSCLTCMWTPLKGSLKTCNSYFCIFYVVMLTDTVIIYIKYYFTKKSCQGTGSLCFWLSYTLWVMVFCLCYIYSSWSPGFCSVSVPPLCSWWRFKSVLHVLNA